MEWLKYIAMSGAVFLVAFGLVTLAMAWLAPRALDTRFMRWMLTGERLEPTRRNRVMASAGSILSGVYILLTVSRHVVLALLALVAWALITVLLRRARTPARPLAA